MSRKYFDRLLTGTGETNKEVKSKFGTKMLENMGWSKGKGLGKNEDGMKDCIQIKRREEGTGLGDVNLTPAATFKWGDCFWDEAYNTAAKNFAAVEIKPDRKLVQSDSSDQESTFSDFEIEKSSTRIAPIVSEKSKKIKKEKKEKKDKKTKKEKKSKRAKSDSD